MKDCPGPRGPRDIDERGFATERSQNLQRKPKSDGTFRPCDGAPTVDVGDSALVV